MSDGLALIGDLVDRGSIDPDADRWLVGAFKAWWRDGADPEGLPRYLRVLPASRSAVATRDYWLGIAAGLLPEQNRAATLQRRCVEFMRKTWPAWRSSSQPPPLADEFDAALFFAADAGAEMRLCARQWRNIVRKSFPE